jgi:predicted nucleotidyltransferase
MPEMPYSVDAKLTPVDVLRKKLRARWRFIMSSRRRSTRMLNRLHAELKHPHLIPPINTTLVVYGSLARGEFTSSSDVDWTLLVDGNADPYHQIATQRISSRMRELKLPPPTPGGPFGSLTFSHDLIHRIGGEDDTNQNTTQRLLLLLESKPVGTSDAYDRVFRSVLARYVEEDLVSPSDSAFRVPRFLQNDIARYWRTMAVDFAHKRRERGPAGWALRTAKLRMSRKLMYAAGLLSCFSCDAAFAARRRTQPWHDAQQVEEYLFELMCTTPLDIIARVVLLYFGELSGPASRLFEAYDEFLGMLHDKRRRKHLKKLPPRDAGTDREYRYVRELGARFEDALIEIFFGGDTPLRDLTIRYGVF